MVLSRNQSVFGIHSITAYNPDTFVPFGTAKVTGAVTFNQTGESIPLIGGSNLNPWEVENGTIDSSGTMTFKEIPDWLYEAFMGNAAVTNSAEPLAGLESIVNLNGTSTVAATGIASVDIIAASETDVKTGIYMVLVVSATTVDVYGLTDVDFGTGTNLNFVDDSLKITAAPLTIVTATPVTIPSLGLELTGGAGAIGMTIGDTAFFDARAINTGSTTATIGISNSQFVDTGLVFAAQRKGNSEIFLLDVLRTKVAGVPFPFEEKAWMNSEVNFTAFYDTTRNAVFRSIRVDGA